MLGNKWAFWELFVNYAGGFMKRGILGEIQLENLLANVLPPELFQMQYSFSNNEIVDAIIKVGEYIIPIDAKFSLDNYNKMIETEEIDNEKLNDLGKKLILSREKQFISLMLVFGHIKLLQAISKKLNFSTNIEIQKLEDRFFH